MPRKHKIDSASSSDEDSSPKKHKDSSSSSAAGANNTQQYPPQPPYPPGGYNPQTMGYPPYMGYPPGQPGQYQHPAQYPPYNYNYPNYNYPTQAPPAAYYNNNYSQQELEAAAGFARGFLIGMMLLFFFIFFSTIIMWAVLRPEVPEFKVQSLSVTNFNAKPNAFSGAWDANVTAKNPNTKIRLFFNQIETFMFFGDEELASNYANPFSLDINGAQSALTAKMAANRTADGGEDEGEAMKKMAEDFGKGAVEFNLRMAAWTTFRSDSWWTRRSTVRVFCEELKVEFSGKSGKGSLVPGGNRDCLVLV
ncbi:NDR1/HIN1-like protein 1 [Linum perenne]